MYISKKDREAYKKEAQWVVESFIKAVHNKRVITFVQTLKQWRRREDNTLQHISQSEVIKLARLVSAEVNRGIYKNAYIRHDKRTEMLWTLEGQEKFKQMHLNLAFAIPDWMCEKSAKRIVKAAFKKKVWSRRRKTTKQAWNPIGWSNYMTKEHETLLLEVCNF